MTKIRNIENEFISALVGLQQARMEENCYLAFPSGTVGQVYQILKKL